MTPFSKRFGFEKPRDALQLTSMDDALRVGVWNWLYIQFLEELNDAGDSWESHKLQSDIVKIAWRRVLKHPLDDLPGYGSHVVEALKQSVRKGPVSAVYSLLECFLDRRWIKPGSYHARLVASLNHELELEQSGYRYIGDGFVAITSPEELEALGGALKHAGKFQAISDHLAQAAAHLSDREQPDYRNSVKEAISAVEAACRIVAKRPKATLAEALRDLEARGLSVPVTLRTAFDKLYAWTSSADGIRHAMVEDDRLTAAEARFMLIACSAFSNYLVDRSRALENRE